MYPSDNIFSIYYNIGKRTPFLVKGVSWGWLVLQAKKDVMTLIEIELFS